MDEMEGGSRSLPSWRPDPLPSALLQPWLDLALDAMVGRHPAVFRRLAGLAGRRLLVVVHELPFAFELDPGRPALRATPPHEAVAATIRASLPDLFALLEGRLDADAAFFERALVVEGDLELVLAIRNAVEDADIDLVRDLAGAFGPLAPLAERAARDAVALQRGLARALEAARDLLLAPVSRRVDRLERELRRLEGGTAGRPARRAGMSP
jgi:O2-independent ubiquinone biosynthesis accessory factor UbiT